MLRLGISFVLIRSWFCSYKELVREWFGKNRELGLGELGAESGYHIGILGVREINLARIHLERASIVGAIHILRRKMEMQVRKLIGIRTVVDLDRIEQLLHGTSDLRYICHERIALLVSQLVEVVDMVIVGYKATAVVGLLLEKKSTRDTQVRNLNHKVFLGLIVLAIQTVFGVGIHCC